MSAHLKTLQPILVAYHVDGSTPPGRPDSKYLQQVAHLLSLSQVLCGQPDGAVARLCHEVRIITQECAHLSLSRHLPGRKTRLAPEIQLTLPVQFSHIVYGTLCITRDTAHPNQASIPLPDAQLLAQICSWLLYTLEQATFLQSQCQQLDYQIHGPLTKREREVLALMCRGYGQEAIATQLCIAPATVGKHKQHIYEQLGVHSERDALLAAYHTGIFSIIEDTPV